jgi:hypothetical protein
MNMIYTYQLYNVLTLYNTNYHLLIATRAPGINSFCKEYSNNAGWLTLSKKKWPTKETFKAYSHGKTVNKELEKLGGGSVSQNPPKKSDVLKKPSSKPSTSFWVNH